MAKKNKCRLFPVVREEVLTMQDVEQNTGWAITAFNLPHTWEHTKGEGIKVAVLDTGCQLDHVDLVDNLLPGKNFINPKLPPNDDCPKGHGTHATGIICAMNNNTGMVGVAPQTKVLPVKVLDKTGQGNLDVVAEGIRWAADQGVDFISLSLGSPNPLQQIRKAIQYADKKGVVIFCAAGNSGFSEEIYYPAAYPEPIAIGAIDENLIRCKFSATGKNLDFMAPGSRILSTVPKNWYAILSGTSMACPWAVGVACLLKSFKNKGTFEFQLETAEDFRNIFKKYATDIADGDLKDKSFYEGFGIIDPRNLDHALDNFNKKNSQ